MLNVRQVPGPRKITKTLLFGSRAVEFCVKDNCLASLLPGGFHLSIYGNEKSGYWARIRHIRTTQPDVTGPFCETRQQALTSVYDFIYSINKLGKI